MNKKAGVTMIVLAISLAIMLILITSSSLIGANYLNSEKLDNFKTTISAVTDNVNAYILANKKLPVSSINIEAIIYTEYGKDFQKAVENNNDQKNKLYVVDISKLGNYTLDIGKGSLSKDMDVFVIAENTNNVYYLKGFEYKGTKYYTK